MLFNEKIQQNYNLKKYNSWKLDAIAQYFYQPSSIHELANILKSLPKGLPINFLGLGSNVLVPSKKIKGLTILMSGNYWPITLQQNKIHVEAGLPCAKVARFSARNNLLGAEFLAGIPGTIGGALRMNAGAFGNEVWDIVTTVDLINRKGEIIQLPADQFKTAYRSVKSSYLQDAWFIAANLKLAHGDGKAASNNIKQLLKKRSETQPTGVPTCGSVFKNPENHHAAQLIESANLKGYKIGGAEVSNKHANFIINTGSATSNDIKQLISFIQSKVYAINGIKLELEVKFFSE